MTISAVQAGPPRRPSTFAKFNAAKHVCMRLDGLASEACGAENDARMYALRNLLELWNSPAPAHGGVRPRPTDDAARPVDEAARPVDEAARPTD